MTLKVTVLDMQPIDPPVGGGRLRLLGLYHSLGSEFRTTYVGTYDWPGESYRKHRLSETLEEIDVPLSADHFRAAEKLKSACGGKNVIDTAFHLQAEKSQEYVETAREAAREADIVVFSHPWVFPLVRDVLNENQLIVYESHNVEGLLRTKLLDDGAEGTRVAREAVRAEYELAHFADMVLACSQQDRLLFSKLYSVPVENIQIVPNGVFTSGIRPASLEEREATRRRFDIKGTVAFFLGSPYTPNVEAAQFICDELAPACPDVTFVIGGGVGDQVKDLVESQPNVRLTGFISDQDKVAWLQAVDVAVNPMFSGSGTNIKMFDFMAAGLPIVSTSVGARGIESGGTPAFRIADQGSFAASLQDLVANEEERSRLAFDARAVAERKYSWERISHDLGDLFQRRYQTHGKRKPFYSVVIPSYERHDQLTRVMRCLQQQCWTNFEVIVVDQSAQPWPDRGEDFGFSLHYQHTDVKGAIPARNRGVQLARGDVIAFTDDDCEPSPEWLSSARPLFDVPEIVGVEGLVKSDRRDDREWRAVTNEGFAGIGFMTANLFVRRGAFHAVNGFDDAFDNPHFREDTDLGWRLEMLGRVPFSEEAWVYHPPHRREVERESTSVRARFFEKDALLMKKHPDRYRKLFYMECHWQNSPDFVRELLRGARKYQVRLPEYVQQVIESEQLSSKED